MTTKKYKVVVAGSINMDVVATTERHPKVGETVSGHAMHFIPGGKGANQAVAAAKLGATTFMVGKVGIDGFGSQLTEFLKEQGVNIEYVSKTSDGATGTALIVVAQQDNTIVVVPGANGLLTAADARAPLVEKGDMLVSQFEIPEETILAFFQYGKERFATTILSPAPAKRCSQVLLGLADIIVLNETELAFFVEAEGIDVGDISAVCSAARRMRRHPDQIIVVTLGGEGVVAVSGERDIRVAGRKVSVVDTTGAGDCYVGALAAKLAAGVALDRALEYANIAAAISVQRLGAGPSMPTRDEVEAAITV